MSVVVSAVSPGIDVERYEAVTDRVMPGGQLPEGCQLHIAGPVDQGWRVITVWDTREAFDQFRQEKLMPAFKEVAGGGSPPVLTPEVNEVHKLIVG